MNPNLTAHIQKARQAQREWASWPYDKRSLVLQTAGKLLTESRDAIAATITEEMGKMPDEALADCDFSNQVLQFFAAKAPAYLAPEKVEHEGDLSKTRSTMLHFEPLGVIGAIKPWNFPLDTPLWTIAPALMAGNAVLLKPSPITPKTAKWIEKLFEKAGAPVGLMQVLSSDDEVGKALVASNVDMISFTGSTKVGKEVAKRCGEKMIPYLLEMGGKDAAIVLPDCDMELTAELIALHGMMNNGQCCTAIERVFVHENIFDNFVRRLVEKVQKRPIVRFASAEQFEIASEHLKMATRANCKVHVGGKIIDKDKWLMEPTVVVCESADGPLWTEETFGPILPLYRFSFVDEVISLTNKSPYGLGASVWTSDHKEFQNIASKLEVGMVWQNDANLPFNEGAWTGWKDSGFGHALGKYGTRAFTKMKQISAVI